MSTSTDRDAYFNAYAEAAKEADKTAKEYVAAREEVAGADYRFAIAERNATKAADEADEALIAWYDAEDELRSERTTT